MEKTFVCQEKGKLTTCLHSLLLQFNKENGKTGHERSGKQDLFSASHQQVISGHFLGSRTSVCAVIALEEKCHNNKCHPSSFHLDFLPEQMSHSLKNTFGQFWVSCPGCVPSQDPTSSLRAEGEHVRET